MGKKERHHFISQFYLRGFASSTEKRSSDGPHFLNVLDIKRAIQFRASVRDIACQKRFNRLEDYTLHPNELEDNLADIEGKISQSLYRLMESKVIDDDINEAIVTLMALFASRTPAGRERIKTQTKSVEDAMHYAMGNFPHLSENRSDGVTFDMLNRAYRDGEMKSSEYTQDQLIRTEFVLVRDLNRDLRKRTWHLLDCSDCDAKFVSSDNPVVLCHRDNGIINPHFSGGAVLDIRTVVYFPITSDLAFYGLLDDSEAPPIADTSVSNLNTWMVNNGCSQLFSSAPGFSVIDENSEIQSEQDVLRVSKVRMEEALKNQNSDQQTPVDYSSSMKKEDCWVMDVEDFVSLIQSDES